MYIQPANNSSPTDSPDGTIGDPPDSQFFWGYTPQLGLHERRHVDGHHVWLVTTPVPQDKGLEAGVDEPLGETTRATVVERIGAKN